MLRSSISVQLTGKTYTPGDYEDRDTFAMRVLRACAQ